MSDITFNCPKCQQQLEAPREMIGETAECPNCNQQMIIPTPVTKEATPSMPAAPNLFSNIQNQTEEENKCPECNNPMPENAVLCVACGFHTKLGKKISTDLG